MAYLYRHIRTDKNTVFYVGIGEDRATESFKYTRAYSKHSRSKSWRDITNMIEYQVEIILENLTWQQACDKEREFIRLYGRRDLGLGTLVNHTDGGDGQLGAIHSEERRKKQSDYMTGIKNSMYGKKHLEKTKEKISKAKTGVKLPEFTQEHKDKIGIGNKGKKRPDLSERNKLSKGRTFKMKRTTYVRCPHCEVTGRIGNMKRWHFDHCKNKRL